MGNWLTTLFAVFSELSSKEARLLMLGLDNSGKTSALYKMKVGEVVQTIPTIGFNVETLSYKNLSCTVWDVGGQHKIRQLWRYYFSGMSALIFVVDSNDVERFEEAAGELRSLLSEDLLMGVPLLVLANKQDLPNAAPVSDVVSALALHAVTGRKWNVQACSAVSGDGIVEGFDWLSKALCGKKGK